MITGVTIKSINPTGPATFKTPDGSIQLETYTLILDDDGVEKATVVACKPEHNKAVGKALLKRLVPLRMEKKGGNNG